MREVAHAQKCNTLSDLNKILHGGKHPYANFGEDRLRGLGVAVVNFCPSL